MAELTPEISRTIAVLETLLKESVKLHTEMVSLVARKQQALREADEPAMYQLSLLENEKLQAISEMEKNRLRHVADLTLLVQPGAAQPMRLSELAEHLPDPERSRLLVLRQQLRERMVQVKEQAGITRKATESLLQHVGGLLQTIGAMTTGVSTYTHKGARPEAASAIRSINLTA